MSGCHDGIHRYLAERAVREVIERKVSIPRCPEGYTNPVGTEWAGAIYCLVSEVCDSKVCPYKKVIE